MAVRIFGSSSWARAANDAHRLGALIRFTGVTPSQIQNLPLEIAKEQSRYLNISPVTTRLLRTLKRLDAYAGASRL
jgi:hypothetical protein